MGRVAVDWIFNAWGEKYLPWDEDAALARAWAEHAGDEVRSVPMVLEGGSIAVDGEARSSRRAVPAAPQPEPGPDQGRDRAAPDRRARHRRRRWLPTAWPSTTTPTATSTTWRPSPPGLLVLQGCDDEAEPDWLRCNVNRRWAAGTADARRGPRDRRDPGPAVRRGRWSARRGPYLQLLRRQRVRRGAGVRTPGRCRDGGDHRRPVPRACPVPLDVGAVLAYGGGGIHCITQQVPAIS